MQGLGFLGFFRAFSVQGVGFRVQSGFCGLGLEAGLGFRVGCCGMGFEDWVRDLGLEISRFTHARAQKKPLSDRPAYYSIEWRSRQGTT